MSSCLCVERNKFHVRQYCHPTGGLGVSKTSLGKFLHMLSSKSLFEKALPSVRLVA